MRTYIFPVVKRISINSYLIIYFNIIRDLHLNESVLFIVPTINLFHDGFHSESKVTCKSKNKKR